MFKKIISIVAIAAALVACNKESNPEVSVPEGAKTLVVNASLGNPATRLSYSEKEDGSYKAVFSDTDVLYLYFLKEDNTVSGSAVTLPIDAKSISFDGKSASFSVTAVTIPSDATKVAAYLATTAANVNYTGGDAIIADLSSPANLVTAQRNQVIYGSVNVSDLKSTTDPAEYVVSIPFAYKTSLLRFKLTLPAGAEIDNSTTVVLTSSKDAIHNKVNLVAGDAGSLSEKGDITANAITYGNVVAGEVTAAMSVWATDDLSSSKIKVVCGDDNYSVDFVPASAIAAGKVYDVARTVSLVATVDKWVNDESGSVDFAAGGAETVSSDWLSAAGGKVSWTANTTGAPRSAKLSFANGSIYEVSQLSPADFKGSYSFTSKIFCPDGVFQTAGNKKTIDVTFGDPLLGETLTSGSGASFTNNLGVRGLFHEGFVADACVSIDYDAQVLNLGMFLDARKAQKVSALSGDYQYAAILPGLCTTSSSGTFAGPWQFVAPDLGTPDFEWLWFETDDFKTFTYSSAKVAQILSCLNSYAPRFICGMSVVLFKGEDATGENAYSTYNTIYQFNTDAGNVGLQFVRK